MNCNYYELSHPQKRIWFTEERYEGTAFANLALTVRYKENIDFSIMSKAINIVIKKNDGMRIRLIKIEEDIKVRQYINLFEEYIPDFFDFSDKDENTLDKWLKNKTIEPFNLIENDLFYFSLIKFNNAESGYYIKMHHIISDGWTLLNLLIEDIERYYDMLKNGLAPDDSTNPSYIDFILREKEYLASPQAEKDREFWLNALSPLPEEAKLTDTIEKNKGIDAKGLFIKVPSAVSEKMYNYCSEYKVSVFKLLLSAMAMYISRLTSSNSAVIGSASHNRNSDEQKKMTGMFVSTIPLKINIDKSLSFNEFVKNSGSEVNNIIKNHGRYPFDLLAGELRKKFNVSPDYLLNVNLIGHTTFEDGRKKTDRIYNDFEPADLSIHIFERRMGDEKIIELEWDYQINKFAPENIKRIHAIIFQILNDALSAPDKKISKIGMCPPEEEKMILEKFRGVSLEIPKNLTVPELFEKQADLYPDNIAVVHEERRITYGELNRRANHIAARLRKDGIKPDMPAGILTGSNIEMMIAIVAVLKAGGCYVPIDPEYPSDRISYMLEDSGAKILLTKKNLFNKFNFNGIIYDLEDNNYFRGEAPNPEIVNTPDNLAYMIYTSGTTGRPKGVMIEHHSLINLAMCYKKAHGITSNDNTSKFMAPAFDSSVLEIFPTILCGATLHVIPSAIRLSPEQLNEYYEKNNIVSAILPTQFGEQFMIMTRNQSLRWVEIAGEKLRSFTPQKYEVFNGYGPTEYTVVTSFFKIDKFYDNIPIGKPVYNTSIYIMDGDNNLLPIGMPGELCVGGEGLSRGYLNKKELTEDKFIENPFCPGKKIYKTGDLARWLPDGNVEYLGRMDRQLKLRGFRIELAEIEQAIRTVKNVKNAVVADHVNENNRAYLCGYYISDVHIDADELKKELAGILPDYMIPAFIMRIDKIPLTPHGKTDKKALPVPDKSLLSAGFVAPSTDAEQFLAGIWKDVLKCDRIGIHDNFFGLGGDSIMSIQVSSRARKAGLDISAGDLQAHPTIHELLNLEKTQSMKKKDGGLSIGVKETSPSGPMRRFTPGDFPLAAVPQSFLDSIKNHSILEAIYGLSPLQEGFLFYAVSAPDSDQYCTQTCWAYNAKIDADALRQAWNEIYAAHQAFRTGFVWEGTEKAFQVVYKKAEILWNVVDMRETAPDMREEKINDLREKIRHGGMNLSKPPISLLHLIILGDSEYRFIWTTHHILTDGWSMPLILTELHRRYDCIINKEIYNGSQPQPFETYIKWVSEQDPGVTANYWKKCLHDFSAPTPFIISKEGGRLDIHKTIENTADHIHYISDAFLGECQKFAKSHKVTLNSLFQTAWSAVLSVGSGSDDILYGTTVSGRPSELADVENMIGLFINTVPVRVKLNPGESVVNNLKNIHDLIQESSRQCHISLNKIQQLSSMPPGDPLFYSIFVFENFPFDENARGNESTGMSDIRSYGKSSYPMNVVVSLEKGLSINTFYDADCFCEESVANMAVHIECALKWIIENPNGFLKDIDMLPEKEKEKLLVEFNRTDVELARNVTIHELIEASAEKFPDKTAVVYKDDRLSYRELNERANRLAHKLRSLGVKPDERIGVLVDRSCDMITGPLAVLKAGAAFVPIDPQYPADRINYILSDSSCPLLLTQPHLAEKIKPTVMTIDMTDPANYSGDSKNPVLINNENNLAYLIYTSGSTGLPKGSMIEHHSLVNICLYYQKQHCITELDNFAKYVSFGFDASIIEIFPALVSGAAIYVIPEELRLSPAGLNEYFEANNITMAVFPTPFGEQFMTLTDNKSLRWLELGGDKLKVFKKQKYMVVNGYGPTECAVCATDFVVENRAENIPIGKPVYNTKIYIIDRHGKLTPAGIPGELCIAGAGVGRGYLGREELTREKFTANPFEPGKKMYKTGDLARWLPDGNIEFMGRIDQQVKIRGFRIELGEIESAVKKIQGIKECVVIDRDDSGGNKYLCGYYTSDISQDAAIMRNELAAFLPDYMIPSYFLKIGEMPYTTHGKVDKKSLPAPNLNELSSEDSYVPPGNAVEEILARIWKNVLKCERIGIHDNFFSLGGDSIMSIQVVARACAEGLGITAAQILKNPTISALSSKIQVKQIQRADTGPLSGDLPLTPIQNWFFENQFTNFNHFNQSFLFKLKNMCRKETIEKILGIIVEHHDCLRLRLKNDGGVWSQRYKKAGEDPVVVETFDLRDVPAEKAADSITDACSKIQGSLNISEGPIIKAALFTGHPDAQDRLFIAVHHISIDMVSWRIIIEDFHALYDKITAGEDPILKVKTSSYRQWAEVLGKFDVSGDAKKHWLKTLEEAPKPPAEYKRSSFGKMKDLKVSLDAAQTELLLNSVPAAYGTKINDILLSALLVAFNRATGAAGLLVSLEGHGREEIPEDMNISRTVGWFTSVFPVHLKSPALSDMGATIKSIKEMLRSVPDSGLSYGILRYLSPDSEKFRSLEKKAVGFNYLGRIDSSVLDGKLLCGAPEPTGAFMAPENGVINLLDINGFVAGGELVMDFGYSTDIWNDEAISAIAANYIGALKDMIALCMDPSAKRFTPSDFPLAAVTQAFLDGMEDQSRIESIYALSPLQEGMLFHAMYSPQSDEYTMQINWRYKEQIDVDALERSWKEVISRHAILRTAFVYKDLDAPVQIVYKSVETPWNFEDWSGIDESGKKQKLEQYFLNERLQGFELSKPCLMKFTLVKLAEADFAFAWTSHHIIQDGWSLPIIMTETNACYEAFIDNKKPDLTPAVSYEEYIRWLSGSKKDEARKFWKEYLKGFSTSTPIPIALSGAKPGARGHMSNLKEIKIDFAKEFARDCESFAKANKITVNSLLQTAWAAVLSNYSGHNEVLFGATVSGRPAELRGVENIVGLFINAIPVRARLDDNAGALTQMTNFHRSFQESTNHFTLSLSEIQSFASVPASESLFNSLFIFQNYPFKDAAAKREKLNKVEIEGFERTNYPITLIFTMQEIISLKLLYDGASFDDSVIKSIGDHLYEAACWLMQNPGRPIKDAKIISQTEEKRIVRGFNDTARGYDPNKLVKEYIEEAVEKFGDKTAVIFGGRSVSYRELNDKANSLAHILIEKGIGRGKTAGILIERSIEMVIAVIAVIKSGGAYIPIDHEYPASRIAYMMGDAGAQILLTKPELIENLDYKGAMVRLDDESVYAGEKKNPLPLNMPSDTATIIYTSGSTGNPKGVITLHGALSHFCLWYKETRNISEKDNMTKYVSFGFDVTMWEIFPALISGATLHVISGDIRLSPYQLNEYFEKNNITLSFLPTQFCEQFTASVENSSLRWLDTAGEKLRTYTQRNYTIANCYGPTEYTDCISWLAVERQYVNIPIGKPIWNTRIYILGEGGKLVPTSVPGELCVAGAGMTGGYLNRPDLTEAKYMDNPIVPGEKIYRTGDLARWLPDGNLEYMGRIDTQVKIRGFRIELSEVEQVIKKIGWVSDAAVIDREDESGRKYLCAYYVAGPDPAIPENEQADKIRSLLKGTLPDYMTPQFIIKIGVIPLTPNGKIDRKSLPAPGASLIKKEEFVAPKTETEKKMAGIWEDVLGLKTIGTTNNFFELGGHSLKAALLQSRMQKEFGVTIALKDIFDHPNIFELSGIVEKSSAKVAHIGLAPEMQYYPASPAQKRIMLLSRMEKNGMTYNIPTVFILEGYLDPKKLGDAIDAMVDRHEILRTSFHITGDGQPVQNVHKKVYVKRIYRQADEKEIETILRDFIRPFNLEKPPLIRFELIKTAPNKHALIMDVHHIIFDGISYDIFLKELWSLYDGKNLEPLMIQFKDFAFWQDSLLQSGGTEKQKKYWLDVYRDDIPQLNLTTDFPRSPEISFHGKHRVYSIDGALTQNLRSWSGRKGSTLFVTLFSAFSVLISRYSSQKDIIIATPGAGRNIAEAEPLIGMFVNTLPIRTAPESETPFDEFVRETGRRVLAAYDNQDYQLDALLEDLNVKRDSGRNPLFDVMFTLINKKQGNYSKDIAVTPAMADLDVAKLDIAVSVIELDDRIDFTIEYRDDLFRPETIDGMGRHFINMLADIVRKEGAMLKDLQMLSEEEKRKLLYEFNDTARPYDTKRTIHEMIEECAALYPDNTAVVCKGRKLNYGQLNDGAAVLCEKLLSRGIKGNGIIAIMVSQRLEMIPAILAILKSGSAFLPIDPSYPSDRIGFMLKDAEVKILLTEKQLAHKVNFEGTVICLDEQGLFEGAPVKFEKRGNPSELAYIIYTSGTTGKPKGVMIEHSSLINLSLFGRDLFGLTYNDAASKYAGFSFDAGIMEIFPCLVSGAALHIIPEEMRLSPDDINEYFEKNKITCAFLPTQFAEQFMELKENSSLKTLYIGGDKLRVFKKRSYNVINVYGPTEYTVATSTFKIDTMYENIPIGKPIANSDVYILDADGRLLPAGVPGELYVAGPGLARGYLKRPELTAEKFVNNPFRAGQKMYRTGDLARWLPDGNIEFMGRIDEQVKIRGYRIELGEIEHALKNCDGIKDAVVIARDLGGGDKTLCAYIVAGPEVAIDAVKAVLKRSLPEYMVPSYFVNLNSIPLTPNGKTDRKKLPEPDIKKEKKDNRMPETETEIKIYDAWKKVLGISDISMADNFFALGGHSLKAVALVAELQKDFEIRLNDVFKYQTISELSANTKRTKDNLKRKLLDLKKQMSAQDDKSDPFAAIANDISAYRTSYQKYAAIGASPKKNYRNILLTGATGFLGSYLLRDLLTETGAAVFVPVRGKSGEECLQRLAQKLSYYFGPEFFDEYKDRITVLKSDLSEENLSLDKELYDSLAEKIDCIINSAANVKHYGLYQEFYISNVKSVDNLIAFASAGKPKDLHHVSTISVGMGHIQNKDAALFTEETVDIGQDSGNYYLQTKLDGEKLIIKAREKGLIANIYRVGNITFDSLEGKFQENIESNGFYQRIRSFINLGIVPEGFGGVDFSYVDGISRAILSLYNLTGLANENFHIENPEKVDIEKILTAEELGLNVQTMDMPAVIDRLIEHYDHGGFREYIENLMVHMGLMAETDSSKLTAVMTLSEKTDFVLKAAGYRWPALSFDAAKGMIYEALKERTGVIKCCPIFKDLSVNELCEISARAGQLYFSDDNPVLQEGAPNDYLYVIAAGAVSISCTSADGWIGTVSIMRKGDFIGEENVFGRKESNVLAEPAAGDVLIFAFKTEDIRKLMTKYPKIVGSFITQLNARIEALRKLIVLMG
jgi:amino acid adenylation domain-containing protein/thioester reductase-like protein/non-ribosomal peptide synthase protein (TIGR01720 family)